MSSAASFIDQIKTEYAEVVAAEGNALPHAIKCGEYLTLAKENLKAEKGGSWRDWLSTNCPTSRQRPQASTADLPNKFGPNSITLSWMLICCHHQHEN
jgi:hypothetical protein